ncbi:MAG TPA: hypothetical protein VHK47_07105 [Polyangia bacterium]|jgi:hypothetical protein|nr:hypothetical protein [Polyangia bacterium]HVZ23316.1 hypothetical protein [Vicinamibacterales bacterium]
MRRALLLVGIVPLLMGSGPCDDGPASPAADGAAGAGGSTGGAGTTGSAGTKGAAGTGASCADRYEPIAKTVSLFQGNWILDEAPVNGNCGGQFILSFEPWTFNPLEIPTDPTAVPGCPGEFLTVTPKLLPETACTLSAFCPSAAAGTGFYVHPYPKNSAVMPTATALLLVKGSPDAAWRLTDQIVGVDPATPNKMTFNGNSYSRTQIVSGDCMAQP